jgi:hypothetical protein
MRSMHNHDCLYHAVQAWQYGLFVRPNYYILTVLEKKSFFEGTIEFNSTVLKQCDVSSG